MIVLSKPEPGTFAVGINDNLVTWCWFETLEDAEEVVEMIKTCDDYWNPLSVPFEIYRCDGKVIRPVVIEDETFGWLELIEED